MNPSPFEKQEKKLLGFVLKGFPRVSETFISNEIALLESMGFCIHIFSMRCPRESFSHASVKEIKADVTYLPESFLQGWPSLLGNTLMFFLKHPRRFLTGLKILQKRFRLAPKKITWLKHYMQAAVLAQTAEAANLGHIHAHFAHTPATVGLYASHFLNVSYSFTAHAKDIYTQHPARIADKVARALFVVTCTKYNKSYLERHMHTGKAVHCVYHGINLNLFSCREKITMTAAPFSILTVARFVPKKGLDVVLRALALLRAKGFTFTYMLLGDGPQREELCQLVKLLGIEDMVDMPGTVTHDQVLNHFCRADVFVLGCRQAVDGDRDGIPNVVAEAMAMGVPVAATRISGIPELVEHGKTGLLCKPESSESLAAIIESLLADHGLRSRIIPAARKRVEEVFDNRKLIAQLGAIYREHGVPCPGEREKEDKI